MPFLQKAGIILGGAAKDGFSHSIITSMNMNNVYMKNQSNGLHKGNGSGVSNLVDVGNYNFSPLETLLYDIQGIYITCLALTFILIIQIIFKFYLKNNIKLNTYNLISARTNENLEYYISKIISLNQNMSNIYIWLILLFIIIGLFFSLYASSELLNNIDNYIKVHSNIKK